jgi:hypothetical protein
VSVPCVLTLMQPVGWCVRGPQQLQGVICRELLSLCSIFTKFFVLFLLVVLCDCILTAGGCLGHILLLLAADKDVYVAANAGTIAVMVVASLMSFPVASLFFYHLSLIRKGKTTREDFKISEARSPYARPRAWRRVLCGPEYFVASEEREAREVEEREGGEAEEGEEEHRESDAGDEAARLV